jgi:uncharacterized protein YebE (UPF0316 family)
MDALFALPYGPFIIFAMRIVDVSFGTIRMLVVMRGRRMFAAIVGVMEVLVWIIAAGSALQHLDSPYHVLGYAAGFGAGTYVGIAVEQFLALGQVVVRTIIPDDSGGAMAHTLREQGYAVTEIDGRGRDGPVDVLNTVVHRGEAPRVVETIESHTPRSFITIEEIRSAHRGTLHSPHRRPSWLLRK